MKAMKPGVASDHVHGLKLVRCPHSLAPTLVVLPWSLALPRACAS